MAKMLFPQIQQAPGPVFRKIGKSLYEHHNDRSQGYMGLMVHPYMHKLMTVCIVMINMHPCVRRTLHIKDRL